MLIDVNIGISNDEGKLLKCFHKRFDERFDNSSFIEDNGLQNNFEDFLNKYLSISGRTMRNQLISEENIDSCTNYPYNSLNSRLSSDEFPTSADNDSLEYVIRIGEGKSVAGKIPLNHILKVENITDKREKLKEEQVANTSSVDQFVNRSSYPAKQSTDQINTMFQALVMKAVECYETNFYHESEDIYYISSS